MEHTRPRGGNKKNPRRSASRFRYAGPMARSHFPLTFRTPVVLVYLMLGVPTQIVIALILALTAWSDYRAHGATPTRTDCLKGAFISVGCGVALMPVAFVQAHIRRVRVGAFGVETCGEQGFRWIHDWDGMETVEVMQFLGWRTLRVHTITGRIAWLPVHVANGDAYREAVAHYAGEDHPVSRALAATAPPSSR